MNPMDEVNWLMDEVNWKELLSRRGSRRNFLEVGGSVAGLVALGCLPARRGDAGFRPGAYPFTLGVASGDPLPGGVVLWTRLAPDPLNGGGMPDQQVPVRWEVAADEGFTKVVQHGSVLALPELAHSVHVEVQGLEPARVYWYRFIAGGEASPVGRTKTAPAPGARVDRFAFAFASCQHYESGYYTAYRHLATEDLDLVVHLGDYIYESGVHEGRPRRHNGPEPKTLEAYRHRYALYKSDPNLQAAHAAFPWAVTWDDHEVENNYADAIDQDGTPPEVFLERRAAAYQAYYEHMPLRRTSMPHGPDLRLYRRLRFGGLAEINVLDTRQYRTNQPCGDGVRAHCAEALDSDATILGDAQERWLLRGLGRSSARWNVLANQVPLVPVRRRSGDGLGYHMDKWNGYIADRKRLVNFLDERGPQNPVVVTGDQHRSWVAELKADLGDPSSATLGTEFVGTSITSSGDGKDMNDFGRALLANNPHVEFFNAQRGYTRCTLTPERWVTDYRVLPYVSHAGAQIHTRASFAIEAGHPGAHLG